MPHSLRVALAIALPLAVVATLILGSTYIQDQQILRQGANEPQIAIAETIAAELSAGTTVSSVLPAGQFALETAQTPFVIVYDETGKPIAGNATLGGQLPMVPPAALGGHKDNGGTSDNRITWQPRADIRDALVITPFQSAAMRGYVVVGRSLREAEVRESVLALHLFVGWVGTMIAIVIVSFISAWLLGKRT